MKSLRKKRNFISKWAIRIYLGKQGSGLGFKAKLVFKMIRIRIILVIVMWKASKSCRNVWRVRPMRPSTQVGHFTSKLLR
jgi:hypothetical protein